MVFSTSCHRKVPFTNQVRAEHSLTESDIRRIQFYLSDDIVLQRAEKNKDEKGTEGGKLVVSSAASMEQVAIPEGTPGVVVKVFDNKKIAVSFEDTDDKYLVFGDPDGSGRYTLLAADWKNSRGKVNYAGKTYYAMPGSEKAYLIFELQKVRKFKKDQRTVGGRKVN